mmetsp:Transcript_5760/g.14746  ORF Transcript_5760/g.14746 Transcript_5760/m.14746 type:complete len:372 (+) Transcript_5760:22-1137(+)
MEKGYFDVPESEAPEPPKAALPHYALPNFSVVLPEYANAEADIIRNAFRTANYTSISNLPEGIKNGTVNESRFERIVANRQPAPDGTAAGVQGETVLFGQMRRLPDKTNKAKYFMEFDYQPSPYSLAEELAKEERAESKRKISDAGHLRDFVPTDSRKRLPHEDVAGQFTEYIIDPFECAGDQVLRQKWLMDAQVLAAPFKPAGRTRGPSGATNTFSGRQQLPEIVAALQSAIEEDWEGYPLLVCATDDEHIVIRFDLSTLEQEPGLIAYMNVLASTNEVVSTHRLKRVVEDWNVTPGDGFLYFTFRPPWVTVPTLETYFALHPEEKVFQDRRAKTADSVDGQDADADELHDTELGPEFQEAARNALPGMA